MVLEVKRLPLNSEKEKISGGSKMFCDFGGGTLLDLFLDSVPIAAGTEDIETMFGKKGLAKLEDTDINIHTFNFNDTERFVKVV